MRRGLSAAITIFASPLICIPAFAEDTDEIISCRQAAKNDQDQINCLEEVIRHLKVAATLNDATATSNSPSQDTDYANELGSEQIHKTHAKIKKKGKRSLSAKIEDASYSLRNELIVFLDNGQVWKQTYTNGKKIRLSRNKDYFVEIKKGSLSGYRMIIKDQNRAISVKRVK